MFRVDDLGVRHTHAVPASRVGGELVASGSEWHRPWRRMFLSSVGLAVVQIGIGLVLHHKQNSGELDVGSHDGVAMVLGEHGVHGVGVGARITHKRAHGQATSGCFDLAHAYARSKDHSG